MVMQLSPEELSARAPQPGSTHGFGVRQALEMARALSHAETLPEVCVVAIAIAPPDRYRFGLSPDVERALEDAADRIVELLEVPDHA
jgi:hydrogenase maturation protease